MLAFEVEARIAAYFCLLLETLEETEAARPRSLGTLSMLGLVKEAELGGCESFRYVALAAALGKWFVRPCTLLVRRCRLPVEAARKVLTGRMREGGK